MEGGRKILKNAPQRFIQSLRTRGGFWLLTAVAYESGKLLADSFRASQARQAQQASRPMFGSKDI